MLENNRLAADGDRLDPTGILLLVFGIMNNDVPIADTKMKLVHISAKFFSTNDWVGRQLLLYGVINIVKKRLPIHMNALEEKIFAPDSGVTIGR